MTLPFDSLHKQLKTLDGAMSLAQAKGYVFALVCAPAPVEPELWLAEVLGPEAHNTDESVLFALMNLHHEISEQVYDTGFNLQQSVTIHPAWQDNLASDSPLSQWASGFELGAAHYLPSLLNAPAVDMQSKEMLSHAALVLGVFAKQANFLEMAKTNGQNEQQFHDNVIDMMGDFALGFAELIELTAVQSGLFDDDESWQG